MIKKNNFRCPKLKIQFGGGGRERSQQVRHFTLHATYQAGTSEHMVLGALPEHSRA